MNPFWRQLRLVVLMLSIAEDVGWDDVTVKLFVERYQRWARN
jgi:hypothetical protein